MTRRPQFLFFLLIPLIIGLDQWSKWLVLRDDRLNALACLDRTRPCGQIELSPVFDLTMVWNRGVSFGLGQSEGVMRWVLVGLTLMIALGFAVWLFQVRHRLTGLALSLVVGGALGNLIDRVRFGAVVDFFDFSGIYFIWVFNVADAAISVGAVLLFIDQFLMSKSQQGAAADKTKEK